MTSGKAIRDSFLDFFKDKAHTAVQSSSLVPQQDPTLLFTNAGMVQFKNIFLGVERPAFKRAASAQKCLRISGKHNDLEAVGRDTYHHTFFEMLGNWSFGDYYKEEAIDWAWNLLTREWGLPKDRLYATVFRDDDEAEGLWHRISGLPAERVQRFDEKDNFWEMGDTGPCGPCSEIHLDRGAEACDLTGEPGHVCAVNAGCARYIELWNLVFIQYNRDAAGTLHELPAKHVDTGMGLERITAVLQGVFSNYDVDLFRDIISATEELAGKAYGDNDDADISFRVIADHARAVSSLIADGVLPSNDGRGYVLRRLLRRAARHGRLLGFEEPFLCRLVEPVARVLGEAYPELRAETERIVGTVRAEEGRFAETLDKGLVLLEDSLSELRKSGEGSLPGDVAFRLYDTYGFPVDLTEDILRGEGITVDHEGFERLMEEQRTRGRAARDTTAHGESLNVADGLPSSHFMGYDRLEHESRVTGLYRGDAPAEEAQEGDEVEIVVAETPFYAESGGQVGDRGVIRTARGDIVEVLDTWHPTPAVSVHRGKVVNGRVAAGDEVELAVDGERRRRAMLNHSATHILHAILREELGMNVRQAGSLVAPDRLRFDFTHDGPVDPEILERIEREVNERVRDNGGVSTEEMAYDDAIRAGAMAFFGDKYGDRVRVVRIGDFSTELCGGTHIHQAGDIGLFRLSSEGGVSAGVRRIEAVTGATAFDVMRAYDAVLGEIAGLLRSTNEDAVEKVRRLLERQKELERQVAELKGQLGQNRVPDLLAKARKNAAGASFIVEKVDGMDAKQLRETVDQLRQQMPDAFVFLACPGETNVMLAAGAGGGLDGRYHAGNIIKQVAPAVGGGGGGRADFAQAGGKQPQKTDEALRLAREIVSGIS
ncbi:MAG: alanine--tRNA ligase [Deltaproteobacteria bacterium]|nr:alanine--tRNA ligase [Deltaproteobacteria bacterium]